MFFIANCRESASYLWVWCTARRWCPRHLAVGTSTGKKQDSSNRKNRKPQSRVWGKWNHANRLQEYIRNFLGLQKAVKFASEGKQNEAKQNLISAWLLTVLGPVPLGFPCFENVFCKWLPGSLFQRNGSVVALVSWGCSNKLRWTGWL